MEMSSGTGLHGSERVQSKVKVKENANKWGEKEAWPEKGRRAPKGDHVLGQVPLSFSCGSLQI